MDTHFFYILYRLRLLFGLDGFDLHALHLLDSGQLASDRSGTSISRLSWPSTLHTPLFLSVRSLKPYSPRPASLCIPRFGKQCQR